ncbi:MAG: uncharacterized protein QG670_2202 [Thermoproteota archaeon]|nr:uncharacterized protein [Thermoproteota archaeon]
MWLEHKQIRERKKQFYDLVETWNKLYYAYSMEKIDYQDFNKYFSAAAKPLCDILTNHFFKENNILFPSALKLITSEEWEDIRGEFEEIGYCTFTPQNLIEMSKAKIIEKQRTKATLVSKGHLQFENGTFSIEEAEAVLNTLSVDITFIDKEDIVRYFNRGKERIFIRTKAVIGRKVQQCHPQNSIQVVNKILESFKEGEKNIAEFWITLNNRLLHIRFFAIKDESNYYLGTLEVVQDITNIKGIMGEKRLLDWVG